LSEGVADFKFGYYTKNMWTAFYTEYNDNYGETPKAYQKHENSQPKVFKNLKYKLTDDMFNGEAKGCTDTEIRQKLRQKVRVRCGLCSLIVWIPR
jgi:hypothetical protein